MKNFEDEKHLLKHSDIDTLHKEFLDIYNSVDKDNIDSFKQKLTQLLEHSKKHFAVEEDLMDNSHYPTKKEHKEEHEKVLAEMNYFISIAKNRFGQKMLQAYYTEKLPHWFDLHLISMDSDLTHHLAKVS